MEGTWWGAEALPRKQQPPAESKIPPPLEPPSQKPVDKPVRFPRTLALRRNPLRRIRLPSQREARDPLRQVANPRPTPVKLRWARASTNRRYRSHRLRLSLRQDQQTPILRNQDPNTFRWLLYRRVKPRDWLMFCTKRDFGPMLYPSRAAVPCTV